MVHWQGKVENPVFPGQAGLRMLKNVTLLLAPLLCAKTRLMFLFGENGVLGTGLQRDRVLLIYSCSNRNVTSLWCHLEPEILPQLCHPARSSASPQPFCLSVGGMISACTVLVQPAQIPDCVSIFRCFASKGKPWVRHTGVSSTWRQPKTSKELLGKGSSSLLHGELRTTNPLLLVGL